MKDLSVSSDQTGIANIKSTTWTAMNQEKALLWKIDEYLVTCDPSAPTMMP